MPLGTAPRSFTSPTGSYTTGGIAARLGGAGGKKGKTGGIPGINAYLGTDVNYQNALNDLQSNFGAYKTENLTNRGNLRQDYADTRLRLGQDQAKAQHNMADDFAARGLYGSGVFLKDQNQQGLDYQNQFTDADSSFQRNQSQLLIDLANARRLKQQKLEDARLQAIRRRAEQYGIRS